MTLHAPTWLQNGSYPASLDRQLLDILFSGDGIVATGDFEVTQRAAGANMSVDVAAGRAVVVGDDVSDQGKYLIWSDATENVTIADAPGTGESRIDLLVGQVRDSDAVGGSDDDFIVTVVEGTAASSPSAPALPDSAILLAQIAVGSEVTSITTADITDKRSQVRVVGPKNDHVESYITANVTMTGSPTEIASITLGAGTWLVNAQVLLENTSSTISACYVWVGQDSSGAGSTEFTAGEAYVGDAVGAVQVISVSGSGITTLSASTTLYLVGIATTTDVTALHQTTLSSIPDVTGMCAVRIG